MTRMRPPPPRQHGALIVLFALMVVVLLGFAGLALDLAQLYSRRLEMQNIADVAALAAAGPLDGSAAGFDTAASQAAAAAQARNYAFRLGVTWNDAALTFGSDPDGSLWYDRAGAKALPAAQQALLAYTRVDTRQLGTAYGQVDVTFMRVLSGTGASVSAQAVAGRRSLRVTPLAVCALSSAPTAARAGMTPPELLEFGFRRGVGYNLLSLSPLGATALNYLVDPVQPSASAAPVSAAAAAPFVCSGTLPLAVLPATLHVSGPFPDSLVPLLNSRFNKYTGTPSCNALTAPPDGNVKEYPYTLGTGGWWNTAVPPTRQTAANTPSTLLTVADTGGAAPDAGSYGVLWAYAKAVQWAAAPPAAGYTAYAKSDWAALYPVLAGAAPSQNAAELLIPSTPYLSKAAKFTAAPTSPANTGIALRRLLNIPLLACADPAGANTSAALLGIGRFFMTAPAVSGAVSAEFAGAVPQAALGGPAELVR